LPDEDPRHERDHVGQEEQHPEDPAELQVSRVQQEGHEERQDHGDRQGEHREFQRDAERFPDLPVTEQRLVVLEPDEP
jgi:hypothetical protein